MRIREYNEHGRNIMRLAYTYADEGMSLEDAITKAGAEYRAILRQGGDDKIDFVKRKLGIKD